MNEQERDSVMLEARLAERDALIKQLVNENRHLKQKLQRAFGEPTHPAPSAPTPSVTLLEQAEKQHAYQQVVLDMWRATEDQLKAVTAENDALKKKAERLRRLCVSDVCVISLDKEEEEGDKSE
jgi:hypothetical protein